MLLLRPSHILVQELPFRQGPGLLLGETVWVFANLGLGELHIVLAEVLDPITQEGSGATHLQRLTSNALILQHSTSLRGR